MKYLYIILYWYLIFNFGKEVVVMVMGFVYDYIVSKLWLLGLNVGISV